jgi:dipeptidyl aminopeptidase/acylaminoacyl peptidase
MLHLPGGTTTRRKVTRRVPGVVFFHGFTGDRMESHWIFVKCARALAQAGIASLRFDFFGSGESDGGFREVTLQGEISDARAAVRFLRRQKQIDPRRLGLLGLSLGGAIAACVAHESRAQALVLWAALAHASQLRMLAETNTQPVPGGDGVREYAAQEISPRFLDNLDKVDPLKSMARFKGPTLILHPGKDEILSLKHPEDFFQAAASSVKEKVIIPGADHTFTSVAWEHEVIKRTVEWFRRHL